MFSNLFAFLFAVLSLYSVRHTNECVMYELADGSQHSICVRDAHLMDNVSPNVMCELEVYEGHASNRFLEGTIHLEGQYSQVLESEWEGPNVICLPNAHQMTAASIIEQLPNEDIKNFDFSTLELPEVDDAEVTPGIIVWTNWGDKEFVSEYLLVEPDPVQDFDFTIFLPFTVR